MHVIKKMIALALLVGTSLSAFDSLASPQAGKEYQVLEQPQPTDVKGKVEVIEFFFYTCPHCNVLDPDLTSWVRKQGNAIAFRRIPVDFGQGQAVLTKMYYTLEALDKLEALHAKIFEAIHVKHRPLFTDQQILDFVVENGVDKTKYETMSNSFGISSKISRAKALQVAYKIDSVPAIYVDGRYLTSPAQVMTPTMTEEQGAQALMQVLDALVSKADEGLKKAPVIKSDGKKAEVKKLKK